MDQQYDETGALGGLFAPAWIYGNDQSMNAVNRWNAAHLQQHQQPPPVQDVAPTTTPVDAQRNNIAATLGTKAAYGQLGSKYG